MSDFRIRPLRDDEFRPAADLVRDALHVPRMDDTAWARAVPGFRSGRSLGAFDPDLAGTARSFDAEMTVPGGARVPHAGITHVGVRADRTRRGVLRALMAVQLEDLAARGVAVASLYSSEAAIYGRFGYGMASRIRQYTIDRHRARLRPEVPAEGEIAVLDNMDDAVPRWPELYAALPHTRPGMVTRPPSFWPFYENYQRRFPQETKTVVHRGPDGVDGFATYRVHGDYHRRVLDVDELKAATPGAFAGLWRFFLGVDLVDEITADDRPLDDGAELLLTDHRRLRVDRVGDEMWLRLINIPAALAAREYGHADPVVLEVSDPLLPANEGAYLITPDGAERTDAPAALRLNAETLAMAYFGAWRPSTLAGAGRIEVRDRTALTAADALFATPLDAWCGTYF